MLSVAFGQIRASAVMTTPRAGRMGSKMGGLAMCMGRGGVVWVKVGARVTTATADAGGRPSKVYFVGVKVSVEAIA